MPTNSPSSSGSLRAIAIDSSLRDCNDFIDVVAPQNAGHKSSSDTLDLVWRGLASRKNGAVDGLDGNGLERRLLGLDVFADPGDRAAGANPGDENVTRPSVSSQISGPVVSR